MKATDPDVTHEEVLRLFQYDASTGMLYWRVSGRGWLAGQVAGAPNKKRCWRVSVNGHRMNSHRLIWFYIHGKWPCGYIDHRDGNGLNNWIDNLRLANKAQNGHNRKNGNNHSGLRGVYRVQRTKKTEKYNSPKRPFMPWCAKIMENGQQIHLGNYPTKEEAFEARLTAEKKYFGEFAWKDDA